MTQRNAQQDPGSFTLHQWFILSCFFSFLLLCTRVVATGFLTYVFLLWNLFLAFIPYFISYRLHKNISVVKSRLKLFAAVAAWLLFVPNSFYILTDLFHLHEMAAAPKWFDLLLLISFAWNGLFFGVASLQKMENLLYRMMGRNFSVLVIFIVMSLNAYGIYIGRFLRYNSWDIVAQPFSLFGEMIGMMLHPFQNKMEWGMVFCYAVFMTLLYMTIRKLAESFNQLDNK